MTRILTALAALACSAPLLAHDGMDPGGTTHRLLHLVGSGTLMLLGAAAVAAALGCIVRRSLRRRAAAAR